MNLPILVTGGAGYIGSFVCKILKKRGFIPITYDNLSTGHKENVRWGPFVKGCLLDKKHLAEVFTIYKPIAVMHFAACALVVESILNPAKYYENNVQASLNLLETMKKNGVKNIVFSSSCATYGRPKSIPLTEDHPQAPINPYGKSKKMVEMMLEDYQVFGIQHAILRYFNAAGASEDGLIGEQHDNETHLIPLLLETAMGKRKSFTIYGSDFPTKDGSAIRDFIHVEDLAVAHIKSLLYIMQKNQSLTLNLGTGKGCSVREMISAIEQYTKVNLPVTYAPKRIGEPSALVCDTAKAKKFLNFTCQHSSISNIIETAYTWHQNLLSRKLVI